MFSTTVHENSLSSTSLPTFIISAIFYNSHPKMCEVIFYCALICISLVISGVEHFFMYLLAICIYFYKNIYAGHLVILWIGFHLFCYWLIQVPCIFWIVTLYQIDNLRVFSPILFDALSFYCFSCCGNSLMYSHLFIFAFITFILVSN